jgi:hypothetical protein
MDSCIDREMASERLKLAEKHVREGQRRVDAQLALMAKLKRDGHSVQEAERLLRLFEELLALQFKLRDQIAQALEAKV